MPLISSIISSKFPFEPTAGQRDVITFMDNFIDVNAKDNTLLIKGYAGTGKTTLIGTLVQTLPSFNQKFVLLAPTGRASKVLSSFAKRTAFTIHKKIYKSQAQKGELTTKFKRIKNYHKDTFFIVDEASMIQVNNDNNGRSLFADLVEYIFENDGNKLVLIGDTAQLPPVMQSESLALDELYISDIFRLKVKSFELTEITRQAEGSGILSNATRIRELIKNDKVDISFNTKSFQDIFNMPQNKLEDGLRYAYDKYGIENTTIICRSNRSAVEYNRFIRHQMLFREDEIEAGDYLMIAKNNYFFLPDDSPSGFLANGEFVEIMKVRNFEDNYGLRFADLELRLLDYSNQEPFEAKVILDTLHANTPALTQEEHHSLYKQVREDYAGLERKEMQKALKEDPYLNALQVKFAYALTCHKSQGGQWNAVFVDQGYLVEDQINKEFLRWVYTAITRASNELYLLNFHTKFF